MSLLPSHPCQDSTIPISLQVQPEQALMSPSPSPAQPACISQPSSRHEVPTSTRSKIHALRHLAGLSYWSIAAKTHISLSTVYQIEHLPALPDRKPCLGRPFLLRSVERKKLIALATSGARNRRKPLTEIGFLAGIRAGGQTLQHSFAFEGYHRRVARKKPYLSSNIKAICFNSLLPLPSIRTLYYIDISY